MIKAENNKVKDYVYLCTLGIEKNISIKGIVDFVGASSHGEDSREPRMNTEGYCSLHYNILMAVHAFILKDIYIMVQFEEIAMGLILYE